MAVIRTSLPRQIADEIRNRISDGNLLPGQRLNERELIEALDVSRTPFREAINILAGEKLVELSPSRGASVRALSDDEIGSLVMLRGALERLAGKLAVESASAADIAEIKRLRTAMNGDIDKRDVSSWWRHDTEFHRSIFNASANPFVVEYLDSISARLNVYNHFNFRAVTSGTRWLASSQEHDLIVDCLERRDGPGLGDLMEVHFSNSWRVAREYMGELAGSTSAEVERGPFKEADKHKGRA